MNNGKNGMTGIWFDFEPPTPSHIDETPQDDTIEVLQNLLIHLNSRITWSLRSRRKMQRSGTRPPFVRVSISTPNITEITRRPAEHLEEIADYVIRYIVTEDPIDSRKIPENVREYVSSEETLNLQEISKEVKNDIFRIRQTHVVIDGKKIPTRKKKAV